MMQNNLEREKDYTQHKDLSLLDFHDLMSG